MKLISHLHSNAKKVVQYVRENGPISRVELSEHMAIPQPTMTRMVEKLIKGNILREQGLGTFTGGRRPILLTFNENCAYVFGVEIGRSDIKVALTNMNGDILSFTTKETKYNETIETIMFKVKNMVEEMQVNTGIERPLILGVGIGIPGPLNETEDGRISPPNFYEVVHAPLKNVLEKQLNYPIMIDNDANVAALAEKWFGQGKGIANFAYVHADVGVGSGLIINHDIYRGRDGEAGEIGHSTIDVFGKKCTCGNYGCLETFVSIPAILDTLQKRLKISSEKECRPFGKPLVSLTFNDLLLAVDEGSVTALQLLKETGQLLGVGITNLINLFAPDLIIIGGKVGTSHPTVIHEVSKTIKTRAVGRKGKEVKVIASNLDSGTVSGAAAMVIHRYFSNPLGHHVLEK